MSIQNILDKIKPFYNLLLILLIAVIFFALGRLSLLEERHVPVKISNPGEGQSATVVQSVFTDSSVSNSDAGGVIGSKSGKKYYFPWCGTVKMIKPENQVKFASIEDARNAGYLPAANCKGLK